MTDRPDADIDYLKSNGVVTFHISTPIKEHSICQFTIDVVTPLDPHGKCAVRLDMDFVNPYKIGNFDDPQSLECDFGVKELKVLVAFPDILRVLTDTMGEDLRITTVLHQLEQAGIKKGSRVDSKLAVLREIFDSSSGPSFTQFLNAH